MQAEVMEEKEIKREEAVEVAEKSVVRRLDMGEGETTASDVQPIRLSEIDRISNVFGEREAEEPVRLAEPFGLRMWPRYNETRRKPKIWGLCLDQSPRLLSRFGLAERQELLKFHNVGLLLEEELESITPAQALILGYVHITLTRMHSTHLLAHIAIIFTQVSAQRGMQPPLSLYDSSKVGRPQCRRSNGLAQDDEILQSAD